MNATRLGTRRVASAQRVDRVDLDLGAGRLRRHVCTGGSPATLAALHDQAGQLLGGFDALQTRLRQLRGYPVVLNAWASWCQPCPRGSPIFAAVSALYGRQVAFLEKRGEPR